MDSRDPVIIIGGGLTGLSTALHLEDPFTLLEAKGELGGLARTEEREGFRFDHTGHWLHLRDPGITALVTGLLGDELQAVERVARIHSHGRLTRYPFQANLHGLPPSVVSECLVGFVRTLLHRGARVPRNFEQYVLHHFGEGIARHFMVPYNRKLWGVHPREITSAWCSRFVPTPDLEQVIAGAVGAGPPELGYNIRFLYPRQGGIGRLSQALASRLDPSSVRLRAPVERIDEHRRCVRVGDEEMGYRALVSTMPLPDLVSRLTQAPQAVLEAASRLRATAVRYLNVASRSPAPSPFHWVYVPEDHLPFYRVGVFSNAMPSMAPAGCSNLYVELSSREAPDEAAVKQALHALVAIGALARVEDVVFADARVIDPAYVVFDEAYEPSVATVQGYLESHRIYSRGRYGSWIYNAMEDSLMSGREVAGHINRMPGDDGPA